MLIGLDDPRAVGIGGRKAAGLQTLSLLGLRIPQTFLLAAPIKSIEIDEVLSFLGEESPIAVRSSMPCEDGVSSKAGRFRSFVALSGKSQVEEGVTAVIRHARAHGVENACVMIQQSIRSIKAGVLFTSDPMGGNMAIVESIHGFGELLAQGLVNPDRYSLPKVPGILPEKNINALRSYGLFSVQSGWEPGRELDLSGTNVRVVSCFSGKAVCSIPFEVRIRGSLAASELHELSIAARIIEDGFNEAQDVEWAKDNQGFVFLQSRTIVFSQRDSHSNSCGGVEETGSVRCLQGTGVSSGQVRGFIGRRGRDRILTCDEFTPELLYSLKGVKGILAAKGSLLCHAAILAREFGIPCVVGLGPALNRLEDGMEVNMDGSSGLVKILRED